MNIQATQAQCTACLSELLCTQIGSLCRGHRAKYLSSDSLARRSSSLSLSCLLHLRHSQRQSLHDAHIWALPCSLTGAPWLLRQLLLGQLCELRPPPVALPWPRRVLLEWPRVALPLGPAAVPAWTWCERFSADSRAHRRTLASASAAALAALSAAALCAWHMLAALRSAS